MPQLASGPSDGAVDSKRCIPVDMARTIDDMLGASHLNLNDPHAEPTAKAI